jgi:putative DNA primase/helicase
VRTDFAGIEPDELRALQRSQAGHERASARSARSARASPAGRSSNGAPGARAWRGRGGAVPREEAPAVGERLRVYTDGTLLVPMVRYDVTEEQERIPAYTGPRRLAGLQKILPDGFKLFNKGMDPVGAACRFGPKPKDGDLFLVGEGLATVLSVHQGLERAYTSYVAFVAGNLERVGRMLRAQYPKSPILFLADDDAYLEAQLNKRLRQEYGVQELYKVLDAERTLESKFGPLTVQADCTRMPTARRCSRSASRAASELRTFTIVNTGRTKAREAAGDRQRLGGAWPKFAERELKVDPEAPRLTDFNDLHVAEGIERLGRAGRRRDQGDRGRARAREGARDGAPAAAEGASGGAGRAAMTSPTGGCTARSSGASR